MKVFAIIVTHNPKKWIEKCFTSLENSSVLVQTIVVDNCSNDGSQEIIKTNFPNVIFIQNNTNLGFGHANNLGIEIAYKNNADYFFLLNQDAWIEKNTINNLIEIARKHKDFGVISPVHFNGSGAKLDFGFAKASKLNESIINSKSLIEVPFVNAAIWLITRNCIEKVGGFNPIFFHYCEDNNYVSRLNFHNFKIGVDCNSKGFHDREFRGENAFYSNDFISLQRDLIMTLSDPNLNLSVSKVFLASTFKLFKNYLFKKNDVLKSQFYLKAIFKIDRKKIIQYREISKKQKLAFLDL